MKGKVSLKTIIVILLVVAIIALFIFSLGQYNSAKIVKDQGFIEDYEEAKRRHRWYKKVIRNQKKLKDQLDKRFKWIYRGVRVGIILAWVGIMLTLFSLGLISGLTGVATYTAVLGGFIVGANYLTSGTYYNLRDFLESIKIRAENWVYAGFLDLEDTIKASQSEVEQLEKEMGKTKYLS